jgi:hypothetical protein
MDIRVRRSAVDRITVEAEGPLRAPSFAHAGGSHG